MVQSAENGSCDYCALVSYLVAYFMARCSLTETSMWAPSIIVANVFAHSAVEMLVIEDEHMIKALGSRRLHPTLGYAVGSRRSHRCADLGDPEPPNTPIESRAVATVPIVDQISGRLALRATCLDHLLSEPRSGRVRRNSNMDEFPISMADHEEHIQCAEPQCMHGEETTSPNVVRVPSQESTPAR